jgi:Holliday junction resolvasome RuvABC DNA-binding subunit
MTKQISIVNAQTGEQIVRDMTADELSEWELGAFNRAERETKESEALAAKEAAQAKLEALGLTTDDLKALGL